MRTPIIKQDEMNQWTLNIKEYANQYSKVLTEQKIDCNHEKKSSLRRHFIFSVSKNQFLYYSSNQVNYYRL